MAGSLDMKLVRTRAGVFKIRPEHLEGFLASNDGAEVVGGYETKREPKPDVSGEIVNSESLSHLDQAISQVNALLDAISGLTERQAQAIVVAGYTLATLPAEKKVLEEINGIGPATADAILEALTE